MHVSGASKQLELRKPCECVYLSLSNLYPSTSSICLQTPPFSVAGGQLSNERRFVSLLPAERSSLEISSFSMESASAHYYQSTGDGGALSKVSPARCPAPLLSTFYHRILHLLWLYSLGEIPASSSGNSCAGDKLIAGWGYQGIGKL